MVGPFPPAVYNQVDDTVNVDPTNGNCRLRAYRIRPPGSGV